VSLLASRREVLDAAPFGLPGAGASTFASGNLACAAGVASLRAMADGEILANARRVGAVVLEAVQALADRHPIIGDVRGRGMLLAVELVSDRATKARLPPAIGRRLLVAMARRGLLAAGGGHILRLTPPLVISEELALRGVALLDDALGEIEQAEGLGP
jgi:4-aminobutyrate aminotransferase-like enzyme